MCPPRCLPSVEQRLSGRAAAVGPGAAGRPADRHPALGRSFSHCLDLTHALDARFPSFDDDSFALEAVASLAADGYDMGRWHLIEHSGTHIDAPLHFSDMGLAVDQIPLEQLILPLCVLDISGRPGCRADARRRAGVRGQPRGDPGGRLGGLEALANLALLPPAGAVLVFGCPQIAGASVAPRRAFALL